LSIYATWLSIDDQSHTIGECAQYVAITRDAARAGGEYAVSGDRFWLRDRTIPCSCGQRAPIIYQASHINPSAEDPRGGAVLFCGIPNHCHPSVRGTDTDDGPSVDYGRLSVHQDNGESGAVVLDRKQITDLRDTLTEWLDSRDPEEAASA
jgi:hypothetical protein